ncbi:MAG TPA: nucleoside 2-deoxyribosyltransferase [Candidatus Paceibacterota bacterium]
MNVFFTASIRGGRAHQPQYALIVKTLEKYGTVFSKHIADETLSTYGETNITNREILERELSALEKCDVVVAEVSTPAHGVGYLIGRATALKKRVIALHYGDYALKLTGIIQGDPRVEVHTYKTEGDIKKIIEKSLGQTR